MYSGHCDSGAVSHPVYIHGTILGGWVRNPGVSVNLWSEIDLESAGLITQW